MPVLTKFQDFTPVEDKQRILNHAWLAQGIGTTDFYFLQVDPATGALPVNVAISTSRTKAWNVFLNYASTSVGTGAYVEVLSAASNLATATQIFIFDSGGNPMVIATGAIGAEVDQFYVAQGGWDSPIELTIASGTRISIKSLAGTSTAGYLIMAAFT